MTIILTALLALLPPEVEIAATLRCAALAKVAAKCDFLQVEPRGFTETRTFTKR